MTFLWNCLNPFSFKSAHAQKSFILEYWTTKQYSREVLLIGFDLLFSKVRTTLQRDSTLDSVWSEKVQKKELVSPIEIYFMYTIPSKVSILLWLFSANFLRSISKFSIVKLNYIYVSFSEFFCPSCRRPPCSLELPSSSTTSFFLISRKYCFILLFCWRRSLVMSEYS